MQTVSDAFETIAGSSMRRLSWKLLASFLKDYDTDIAFFTVGESLIGGTDVIKGLGDVVQEWDKYSYEDYTSRIIGFEYTREVDKALGGATLAMADLTLENHDQYFTPKYGSAISDYILPRRPVKLFAGFKDENIPIFVGMIEKMPNVKKNTADFHCVDFLQEIFDIPLDESVIYQDYRTDQIIAELLQDHAGLATNQYSLDTGLNIVGFFFANKGDRLGDILRKLVQAEMGSILMDENGVIRFINRINWNTNPEAWTFTDADILESSVPNQDNVVNVVEVKSQVRDVLASQKIWELFEPTAVPAGGTVEIWADLEDPTPTIDDPEYIATATSSAYSTNYQSDSSGEPGNADIALDSITKFSTSCKMVFSNAGAKQVFITGLDLWGTPAKVVNEIYVREEDASSVGEFEQQVVTIENNYIQDESTARSIANIILIDNAEYDDTIEITVKGVPHLQVGDLVRRTNDYSDQTYYVQKIVGKISGSNGFTQTLTLVNKAFETYFRVGISTIGGADKITP